MQENPRPLTDHFFAPLRARRAAVRNLGLWRRFHPRDMSRTHTKRRRATALPNRPAPRFSFGRYQTSDLRPQTSAAPRRAAPRRAAQRRAAIPSFQALPFRLDSGP